MRNVQSVLLYVHTEAALFFLQRKQTAILQQEHAALAREIKEVRTSGGCMYAQRDRHQKAACIDSEMGTNMNPQATSRLFKNFLDCSQLLHLQGSFHVPLLSSASPILDSALFSTFSSKKYLSDRGRFRLFDTGYLP